MFMLPVPSWVHPAWLICAGLLSLVIARKVVGLRWTATVLAGTYLAYRAVMWLGLVAIGFPPSVLPLVLLVGAVLIDVAVTRRVPGWAAAPVVTAAVFAAAFAQDALDLLPPWNWWAVLPVAAVFAALWAGVDVLGRSRWLARWQVADEPAVAVEPARL
jgi:hypothetical protein